MSYAKLPLVIQDFAAGIQTINQVNDNTEAIRDLYDAEHYIPADGQLHTSSSSQRTNPAAMQPGQHDTPKVPRTVGFITVTPYTYTSGQTLYWTTLDLTGRLVVSATTGRFVNTAGLYLISTVVLTNGWCEAHPIGSSTALRKADVRASTIPGYPGFLVVLKEYSGGGWSPVDCSFSFTIGAEEVP